MNEYLDRQLSLIRHALIGYRTNVFGLGALIQRVEALGHVIGGELWEAKLFPIVVDLEIINSELVDKKRSATSSELSTRRPLSNELGM